MWWIVVPVVWLGIGAALVLKVRAAGEFQGEDEGDAAKDAIMITIAWPLAAWFLFGEWLTRG